MTKGRISAMDLSAWCVWVRSCILFNATLCRIPIIWKDTRDICYSLLTQLALINSSLNELLQSLSAFLARVIMNQHLPVQSICLALLVIRVRYRVRTYFNSKQLPITQMKQGNFQTWSVYWKSLPPMPQLWIRRNNGLEVSKVVLDSPEVLEMVITCSSY